MLDDDVECETEGIIRAITFGDLCRRPTLVGGHMFSLFAKARMHSFGEKVEPYRFWWGAAPGVFPDWDLAGRNLRSARWLHARVDVDYNGWFMCLIPTQVIDEIGLSLPIFIKWDDAEYGLRAKAAGYPTVTFPGAAVWHVPWTDKNDALDWQSYFHQRNRFIAALLHSKYPHGGRMVQESFNHQVKHLVSMQYSTVELRHQALLDVLAGPGRLHEELGTKLPEIRTLAKQFTDARVESDRDAFPEIKRTKLPRKGREGTGVPSGQRGDADGAHAAAAAAPEAARARRRVPRGGDPGPGRQVVPHRPLRQRGRLDARRHLGGALQARPEAVPGPAQADRGHPPAAAPRLGASGRGVPRRAARDHLAGGLGGDVPAPGWTSAGDE